MATRKTDESGKQTRRRRNVGRPGMPAKREKPREIQAERAKPPKKATPGPRAADLAATRTSRGWAHLTDLFGRRAGVRVLWELRAGPLKFRALQAACDDLSPSTLNQRLSDLREARLIAIEERQGYRLTPTGEELVERLGPLAIWAESWSHRRAQKRKTEGPPRKGTRTRS